MTRPPGTELGRQMVSAHGRAVNPRRRPGRAAFVALSLALAVACTSAAEDGGNISARTDYDGFVDKLRDRIEREINDLEIPALSIALIDDQETVWAHGFGTADPARGTRASANTVYRVASVSKLFTDFAVMQAVDEGLMDLDVPVRTYLPEFAPTNPFGGEITLRHMMCHRSGLVREPPVGNYFDSSQPSLEATVASLNRSTLVYEPGTRTKYSNAAIGAVGLALQNAHGRPFEDVVRESIFAPLGMESSSFRRSPELAERLAVAEMWTYDGRVFDAPEFAFGFGPAANLYSTVADLGSFVQMLFADGRRGTERLISTEGLAEMWTPQLVPADKKNTYGIGFGLSELDGHRKVGHSGAVYGYSTRLAALPDLRVGVVAACSMDVSNDAVDRIVDHALRGMLAAKFGMDRPGWPAPLELSAEAALEVTGSYVSEDGQRLELSERQGSLFLRYGTYKSKLWEKGDGTSWWITRDRHASGIEVRPAGPNRLLLGERRFERTDERPKPVPESWRGLIGEYGWDHNTLYVLEYHGRLFALIEWIFYYPLEERSPDVFAFPDYGLYHGEALEFERFGTGLAESVKVAGMDFPRRGDSPEADESFRIQPQFPIDELRARALAAQPPAENPARTPDLVELVEVLPALALDIRYATTRNFLGTEFYEVARAFAQRPAAEALAQVQTRLAERDLQLLVYDAYRPWHVTHMFWDATPEALRRFVADPSAGSRHNRGCAIDLTLADLETGEPVHMTSGYDEFSPRASPDYPGGDTLQRWHRDVLRREMEAAGFRVYPFEWWHFDFQGWEEYPLLNDRLSELGAE